MNGVRPTAQDVLSAPKFKLLRAERAKLRWGLSSATLIMFFGLIVLVWTARSTLSTNMPGSSTPMWFGFIFLMTVLLVIFTAIYVRQSNSRFDRMASDLVREFGQ